MLQTRGPDERGMRLVTTVVLTTGEVVATFGDATLAPSATQHSIQVGPATHADGLGILANLNHSCEPNVRIDPPGRAVIALRDIAPGEELTFFYPSTEWAMTEPFQCRCGSPRCIGTVTGARDAARAVLERHWLAPHVRALLNRAPR